ncbi:MAG: peptidylprolyl isomerase [Thainema sp.]
MTSFSGITVTNQEIIDFLGRDLQMPEIYKAILAQKIINQTAAQEGITVEPDEVQAELEAIRYDNRFDHPAQLLAWVSEHMTTLSQVEQRIREKILAQKLARHLFSDRIYERFLHNHTDFEQLLLYEIVVPYATLAREIFYQIEEDEMSFFEAAHIYDVDEARRLVCGFVGKQLRSQLLPEVSSNLSNAQVGEVVGPIQLADNRFILLLIDDLITPELTPELLDILIDEMFQEWLNVELLAYMNMSQRESPNESQDESQNESENESQDE